MATLLSICQGAADRIGIPRPTQVASSIDQTTRTLLGAAQREGAALSNRWAWQALLREHTFVSIAATAQTGSVPADWDGRMVSETFWNRTLRRPVYGPLLSAEWQAYQASGAQAVTDAFRFRNNLIELLPTPVAGRTYAYEYISENWCTTAGGTGQAAWAADTDVPVLNAELMTLGVMWRFLQGRGMDFIAALQDYEGEVMRAMARDGTRRIVNLAGGGWAGSIDRPYRQIGIAEGSWAL